MKTKPVLVGGLIAAIVGFFLGYLWYGLLFQDAYKTEVSAIIDKPMSDPMSFVYLGLGFLVSGIAMAILYGKTDSDYSLIGGFIFGSILGLIPGLSIALITYATNKTITTTGISLEAAWGVLCYGIMGAIVSLAYDRLDDQV
jgi:hypothetical protein